MPKRALVLGATGELGNALCCKLAAAHYEICAIGRDAGNLSKLAEKGLAASTAQFDLAALPPDLRLNLENFDLFIVAAGATKFAYFLDRDEGELTHEIQAHVLGTAQMLRAVVNSMRSNGSGRVLIIGSSAQFRTAPGYACYTAGKAFLLNLVRNLAAELRGTGVTMTFFIAGPFGTQFAEKSGRRNSPTQPVKDVAAAALRASEKGRLIAYSDLRTRARVALYSWLPGFLAQAVVPLPGRSG